MAGQKMSPINIKLGYFVEHHFKFYLFYKRPSFLFNLHGDLV